MKHESRSAHARKLLAASVLILCLTACGTTSSLFSPPETKGDIDLTAYSRLLVSDFIDEASDKVSPENKPMVMTKVEAAGRSFPDQIASTVAAQGGFAEVSRTPTPSAPDPAALVMRGAITRWDEGDVALRLLVGFGAGNSRFDARIELMDGGSGAVLGTWIVDKNSWALGGFIAATQTPETFLPGAAKAIGEELSARRKAGSLPPQLKKQATR